MLNLTHYKILLSMQHPVPYLHKVITTKDTEQPGHMYICFAAGGHPDLTMRMHGTDPGPPQHSEKDLFATNPIPFLHYGVDCKVGH